MVSSISSPGQVSMFHTWFQCVPIPVEKPIDVGCASVGTMERHH